MKQNSNKLFRSFQMPLQKLSTKSQKFFFFKSNKMVAAFFRKSGYNIYPAIVAIAIISLNNRKTVNAPWY